jgi:threonine dehydrogenase-like Zn-dependent dehydrogenase
MPQLQNVKTSPDFPIPEMMRAWVLGDPGEVTLTEKPVPSPQKAELLVRIDAVAICATDLEIIHHGPPAQIQGDLPFNKNFTPGHEYMGTVVALGAGVDEYRIGQRVTVEIHAGCGQCKRCREGMYTSCLNYGMNYGDVNKGHRANGFTTDGGFTEYAVNHINTIIPVPDDMSDAEATLVVTAGTAMYGLTELGGLVAGESVVVTGPGPIGLMGVAVAKALGAEPVFLTGTRDNRLELGRQLGADHVINVRKEDAVEAVRRLCGRMLRCAGSGERSGSHGQPRRPHLSCGLPQRAGECRCRQHRARQRVPVWHPWRGKERHAPGDVVHGTEALRRHQAAHSHFRAGRFADGAALRARAHRRRHQGGGAGQGVSGDRKSGG